MNILSRLIVAFTYGDEIVELVKKRQEVARDEKQFREIAYLDLCKEHQQRSYGSHFSPHNCDYCKAINKTM